MLLGMWRMEDVLRQGLQHHKIANIYFTIKGSFRWKTLEKFTSRDRKGLSQYNITILSRNLGEYEYEKYWFDNMEICIRHNSEIMLADKLWKESLILPVVQENRFDEFVLQVFYAHAVKNNMIQLHSSLISYQGNGILFLGPSGIGKTTQAELWSKYRDALIINGDIVFVQETPDAFLGWGTPLAWVFSLL